MATPAAEGRPAPPPAPASRPAHTIGGALTGARGLGTVRLRAARPSVAQSVPVLGGVQGPFGAFRVLPPHTTFPRAGRRGGAKASRGAREPQMATLTSRNEGVAGGRFGDGACAFFLFFYYKTRAARALPAAQGAYRGPQGAWRGARRLAARPNRCASVKRML